MAKRKTKQELEVEIENCNLAVTELTGKVAYLEAEIEGHEMGTASLTDKVADLEQGKLVLENEVDMKKDDLNRAAKRANLMEARVQVMQLEVAAAESESAVLREVLTDAISRLSF